MGVSCIKTPDEGEGLLDIRLRWRATTQFADKPGPECDRVRGDLVNLSKAGMPPG